MSNELIARIDFELDAWPRSSTLCKTLKDCRAEIERLSKPYVPMTETEFEQLAEAWTSIPITDRQDWCNYVEAHIIERAGLEVAK